MPSPSPSEPASSTSGSAGEVDLRRRLVAQDRFLEALVGSLRAVASGLDGRGVLERATQQAHAMFGPDATVMVAPPLGEDTLRPVAAAGVALGPLADVTIEAGAPGSPIAIAARDLAPASAQVAGSGADGLLRHLRPTAVLAAPLSVAGRLHAVLVLLDLGSGRGFDAADVSRAVLFADFAGQAAANAALFDRVDALLSQARMREAERAELSRRVINAEQEERRRLSAFLHDGPVQTLSGVGMMLDAVEEAIAEGQSDDAVRVLATARSRQRDVIRSVRELSFVLEPWTLRDQGFDTALGALADGFASAHGIAVEMDVPGVELLGEEDQVHLFQIVREAMQNALKHAGCSTIRVSIAGSAKDGLVATIADDGSGVIREPNDGLPHHGMASMHERAAILGGRLDVDAVPGDGTTVRVLIGPGRMRGDR
jgi:signal transduction histidine kinase